MAATQASHGRFFAAANAVFRHAATTVARPAAQSVLPAVRLGRGHPVEDLRVRLQQLVVTSTEAPRVRSLGASDSCLLDTAAVRGGVLSQRHALREGRGGEVVQVEVRPLPDSRIVPRAETPPVPRPIAELPVHDQAPQPRLGVVLQPRRRTSDPPCSAGRTRRGGASSGGAGSGPRTALAIASASGTGRRSPRAGRDPPQARSGASGCDSCAVRPWACRLPEVPLPLPAHRGGGGDRPRAPRAAQRRRQPLGGERELEAGASARGTVEGFGRARERIPDDVEGRG